MNIGISLAGFQSNTDIQALLPGFVDYSGFYQYVNDEQGERFEKMSILPSLYYDEKNNDICWMFNGQETGISAVGVSGSNGVSATLEIVGVTGKRDTGTSEIVKIARNGKWETFVEGAISPIGGPVIICIFDNPADNPTEADNGNMSAFAFGQTEKNERDKTIAVWDNSMIFSDFLNGIRIYEYLKHIGDNPINGGSRGLWIPTKAGDDTDVHMLYNETKDDSQNLVLKMTKTPVSTEESIEAAKLGKTKKFILNDYQLTAQVNNVNNVQIGMPIGSIVMWPSDTAPDGWLLCDGTAYKRNDYANLFNVIGNKYNNGVVLFDRFKVPNLQSRFPLGASSVYSLGDTGGEKEVTLTKEKIPSHNHTITKIGGHNDGSGGTYKTFSTLDTSKTETGNRTVDVAVSAMTDNCGGQPHNNMPPYLVVNFIIKYK